MLYMVPLGSYDELWYSNDKGANWTQLDVDPSDSSGDGKSRDMRIKSAWHDRGNSIIWFVDSNVVANNAGTNDFDVWKLDYSGSETAPAVTEVGSGAAGTADAGTVWAYDIFKEGTDMFVINYEERTGTPTTVVWEVDTAPFTEEDNDQAVTPALWDCIYKGIVAGTKYYSIGCETLVATKTYFIEYDDATTTLTIEAVGVGGYEEPSHRSQWSCSYDDSDILYFCIKKTADAKHYLIAYSISEESYTEVCEMNIIMMLDRNTASGVMEKGVDATASVYKVYQLHTKLTHQWHLIDIPDCSDSYLYYITDNFAMGSEGQMFEFVDVSGYVMDCVVIRNSMEVPAASFHILNTYILQEGMFVKILDTYTSAASTSTEIIFEGYVEGFEEGRSYVAKLRSPASELIRIRPSGEYSGRSDQIISSLITDYCNYISVGTMSNGGAMGSIDFYGDKTLYTILTQLALFDNFVWYLTPEGKLFYNNGAVDTGEDFDDSSYISSINSIKGKRAVNYVLIKGSIVSGTQCTSDGTHKTEGDIRLSGKNPYERTHSHLDTNALCNTTASNCLTRFGTQAVIVSFYLSDASIGMMQEAETITLEYTGPTFTISSDQFAIQEVIYNAKIGKGLYRVSDRII